MWTGRHQCPAHLCQGSQTKQHLGRWTLGEVAHTFLTCSAQGLLRAPEEPDRQHHPCLPPAWPSGHQPGLGLKAWAGLSSAEGCSSGHEPTPSHGRHLREAPERLLG